MSLNVKVPTKSDTEKYRTSRISAWHAGRTRQMRRATPLLCERFHIFSNFVFEWRATCHLGVIGTKVAHCMWQRAGGKW